MMTTKPILNETLARVNPASFGAVGDGKTDDSAALSKAIRYASENGMILELPETEYYCKEVTVFDRVTVLSHNAKISYYGLTANTPALDMRDDVCVFGTLHVWSYDNTQDGISNHGGRCGISFGNYNTGAGAHNCYMEHVVVTGGFLGTNAVFITGDSSDIRIDRVTVPSGTKYHRAVLAHWGNNNDHYVIQRSKLYGHVEGWKYTKHPHDIKLGLVEISDTIPPANGRPDVDNAAVTLSASYNIEVDEIVAHNTAHTLNTLIGDIGFQYASPEDRAIGMRNIYVKKITGTNIRSAGLHLVHYTGYMPSVSEIAEVTVDECYMEASANNRGPAVNLYGVSKAEIGSLTAKHFSMSGLDVNRYARQAHFGTVNLENIGASAVTVAFDPLWKPAENLKIDTLNVTGGGDGNRALFDLQRINGLEIGKLNIIGTGYPSLVKAADGVYGIRFDEITTSVN